MSGDKFMADPSDGMDAMIVGGWSQQKHERLTDYIVASRLSRAKWGHACYIDVFCGPGRVVERGTNTFRDGGAIAAWRASCMGNGRPFTAMYIGDLHQQSVRICELRLERLGASVQSFFGPAKETVHEIVSELPRGLDLAFLDPFNAAHLDFEIIRVLSERRFMDILVHFSVMDIQRNIDLEAATSGSRLERIAPGWREAVDLRHLPKSAFVNAFLEHWKSLVLSHTQMTAAEMMPLIKNSKNGPLYRLILLRRHPLAEKLWNDVGKEDKKQKSLF
ncbi:three-Cys-motif partner protein TcmP [Caballeronia ptereochthonis]|uniref:Three-Cys-motif partner protein TcmP n=1 Tax=Caballeronia ptereochthonis TaxID=1777144 RepID=A0A158ACC8_9BURK|nr:three-Cys-motif partner protein TcmP [Caballeronia ptereochthonis]SAK55355.1 hypothetical protein AWB83_01633 [Caballeronia ptereochthonis]